MYVIKIPFKYAARFGFRTIADIDHVLTQSISSHRVVGILLVYAQRFGDECPQWLLSKCQVTSETFAFE